ncbi:MAG TPA: pantoate--beta-alanine ligase [Pseudobdellovibrionaceae bacterium]|nr:pantoate--beta-alanine ligase [Pseudobdellovibrionaceae bacterium]
MNPRVVTTPEEYRKIFQKNKNVGFVPTMGALHDGHAQLLKKSKSECDITVLSIFINPTQFNNPEDLNKYPKMLEKDLSLAKECGVDIVFLPTNEVLYPDQYKFEVREKELSQLLCGAHRPGHFEGVLTIVLKLLNIIKPQKAYFGEKDFQQLSLIQEMVKSFFIDVEIVPVPTLRESDGLAMSSRNLRLSKDDRQKAPLLYKYMTELKSTDEVQKKLEENGYRVDYVVDLNQRRFVAAHLGAVRLIDNVAL